MAKRRGNHEGTIYQRNDGRWTAQITLPDGRRKSFYKPTRAEVAAKLNEAQHDLSRGLPLASERTTLGGYLLEWIQSVSNVRASSWNRYESIVRIHLAPPPFGRTPLVQLTRQHILAFYKRKQEAGLSPTTIQHLHTVLGRALREAHEDNLVPRNACQRLKVPPRADHEMLYLSQEQARQFLEHVRMHRWSALFALALATGMRQGELLGLRWKDVTLDGPKPMLRVRLQAIEVRERGNWHLMLDDVKTKGSRRQIKLGPATVQALKAHQARQALEQRIAGDAWQQLNLVFPGRAGGLAGASGLLQSFQRLARQAGLPAGIRFHDLRHTAATLALERGENPKAVAQMLGDSVTTVMTTYAHVTPMMEQSLAATMDSILWAENG